MKKTGDKPTERALPKALVSEKRLKDTFDPATLNNIAQLQAVAMTPKRFLTPDIVEKMASQGLSKSVIAGLCSSTWAAVSEDPKLEEAFNRGRSEIGQRVRTALIEDALEKDLLPAKIYLDKIYGGDVEQKNLNVSITARPLENIPTETLLEFDDDQDQSQ